MPQRTSSKFGFDSERAVDALCVEYPALREVILTLRRREDLQELFPEAMEGRLDRLLIWVLFFGVNEEPALAELSSEIAILLQQRNCRELASHPVKTPRKVHIVTLAKFPESFRNCARSLHNALVRCDVATEYYDSVGATELASLSQIPSDEVVHVLGQGPIAELLHSQARNWVLTIHGAAPYSLPPELHPRPGNDLEEIRANAARIPHVICPTFCARREIAIAYGVPEDIIDPIPHFFDFNAYSPQGAHYESNQRYFLLVASYQPKKNFVTVLDALHVVVDEQDDDPPILLIVGEAKPDLTQLVDEAVARWPRLNGKVKVLGHVADIASVYRGALALISASHHEGFGMPYIEAALCGVAVVGPKKSMRAAAWASQPTRELMGSAAVLVHPERPQELAAIMKALLSDKSLRSTLANKCRERALEYVAPSFLLNRYLHVYGKVLGKLHAGADRASFTSMSTPEQR